MLLTKDVVRLCSPRIIVVSIVRDGNRFALTFVEGKLFPKINEQGIDARPKLLVSGDVIDLSGTKMEFSIQ